MNTKPEKETEFRHRTPVQLRFADVDMFGHVNNAVYIQFLDMGKLLYFKQFMGGRFEHEPTVPVVANINVNYLEPTHIDDRIEVLTAVTAIGESSLVLEQNIVAADGHVKCTARTVMVNIDVKSGVPTPLSDKWRRAFEDFEGHVLGR